MADSFDQIIPENIDAIRKVAIIIRLKKKVVEASYFLLLVAVSLAGLSISVLLINRHRTGLIMWTAIISIICLGISIIGIRKRPTEFLFIFGLILCVSGLGCAISSVHTTHRSVDAIGLVVGIAFMLNGIKMILQHLEGVQHNVEIPDPEVMNQTEKLLTKIEYLQETPDQKRVRFTTRHQWAGVLFSKIAIFAEYPYSKADTIAVIPSDVRVTRISVDKRDDKWHKVGLIIAHKKLVAWIHEDYLRLLENWAT